MKTTESDLAQIRARHQEQRLVFCSGGFDLTHAGHVLLLEDARSRGDVLVVGVASDAVRTSERGSSRAPVLNEHLRLHMVSSLKPVDYAFLLTELPNPGEHPAEPLIRIFERLRPDVWVVNEDAYDIPWRNKTAEKFGIKIIVLPRSAPPEFGGISTSGIIQKIKDTH